MAFEQNCDLILHPSAFVKDATYFGYHPIVVSRAIENSVHVLSVNYAGETFGGSIFAGPWWGPVPVTPEAGSGEESSSASTIAAMKASSGTRKNTDQDRVLSESGTSGGGVAVTVQGDGKGLPNTHFLEPLELGTREGVLAVEVCKDTLARVRVAYPYRRDLHPSLRCPRSL